MATMEENLAYFAKHGKLNVSAQKRKEMLAMLDGELKRREGHQAPAKVGRFVGDAVNAGVNVDRNVGNDTGMTSRMIDEDIELAREQKMERFKRLRNKPYPMDDDDHDEDFRHAEQLKKELAVEIETEQRQFKIRQLEEKIENLKREHLAGHVAPATGATGKMLAGIPLNLIFALLIVAVGIVKFMMPSGVITPSSVGEAAHSIPRAAQVPQITSSAEKETLLALDQRRVELEARSQSLDKREMELGMQERIVTEKIAELKSVYGQLQARRQEIDQKREAKLEQLAEVYSTMAPEQAAPIIAKLDNETALSLLQRMSGKRMGQILSSMNSDRAIELTKGLRG